MAAWFFRGNGLFSGWPKPWRRYLQSSGQQAAKYLLPGLDLISSIPNGGNQGAHGLAKESNIAFVPALVINPNFPYGRSFIQSNRAAQAAIAEGKLIVNPDSNILQEIAGKAIALFDDSLIRATMAKKTVPKLYSAGVARIDLVIGAAPYSGICELGVDTPNSEDLIAARTKGNVDVMRQEIGVDNLIFIKREDMQAVVGEKVCDFCLGGSKPNLNLEEEIDERLQLLEDQLEFAAVPIPA